MAEELTKEQQILADQCKSLVELLPTLLTLEKQIKEKRTNLQLLANTAFVARKCSEICDEFRKKFDKLEAAVAEITFPLWTHLKPPRISTSFVTISDNSDPSVHYPSSPKDPLYFEFVSKLGLEMMRPHYPTICQFVGEEYAKGQQLPFGLKAEECLGIAFKLRITKKRDL